MIEVFQAVVAIAATVIGAVALYQVGHARGYMVGCREGYKLAQSERCSHGVYWDDCPDCRH